MGVLNDFVDNFVDMQFCAADIINKEFQPKKHCQQNRNFKTCV